MFHLDIVEKIKKLPYVSSLLTEKSLKQLIRYIVTGLLAFIAEYTTFVLLLSVLSKLFANGIGMFVGFWISFIMNRYWSFQSKDNFLNQLYRYSLLFIINIIISSALLSVFSDLFTVPPQISKLIIMGMIVCWNFFLYKKIIYRK